MDKAEVLDIIARFDAKLREMGVDVSKIVLFGSYAYGIPHDDSDIDVVVVSKTFEGKDGWERIKLLSKAIYRLWEPIEAIAKTPEEWEHSDSLIVQYARQGEIVVGAPEALRNAPAHDGECFDGLRILDTE